MTAPGRTSKLRWSTAWSPPGVVDALRAALFDSLIVARGLQQMNLTLNVTDVDGLESYVAAHAGRVKAGCGARCYWRRSSVSRVAASGGAGAPGSAAMACSSRRKPVSNSSAVN